jgi:hypothetical protein
VFFETGCRLFEFAAISHVAKFHRHTRLSVRTVVLCVEGARQKGSRSAKQAGSFAHTAERAGSVESVSTRQKNPTIHPIRATLPRTQWRVQLSSCYYLMQSGFHHQRRFHDRILPKTTLSTTMAASSPGDDLGDLVKRSGGLFGSAEGPIHALDARGLQYATRWGT